MTQSQMPRHTYVNEVAIGDSIIVLGRVGTVVERWVTGSHVHRLKVAWRDSTDLEWIDIPPRRYLWVCT